MILSFLLDKAKGRDAAATLLRKAQERYQTDFWINLELGSQLGRQPATAPEAIGFLRAALVLQPKSPVVHLLLADAFDESGKLPEAVTAYHRARKLNPVYTRADCNLAALYRKQKRLPECIEACRAAIALNYSPSAAAQAYNNLGGAFADQGKFADAEEAVRKSLAIKPGTDWAGAYANLAAVLLNQHKSLDETIRLLDKAIGWTPNTPTHTFFSAWPFGVSKISPRARRPIKRPSHPSLIQAALPRHTTGLLATSRSGQIP